MEPIVNLPLDWRVKGNASSAVKKQMGLRAKTAHLVVGNQEVDRVIVGGHSTLGESMLTGEGLPVSKSIGAAVS